MSLYSIAKSDNLLITVASLGRRRSSPFLMNIRSALSNHKD